MIKKLQETDRIEVIKFLSEESSINLFAIGDIEGFGFDQEFQDVYGQYDKDRSLEGVLLRYNENFIPYYKNDDADIEEFSDIIRRFEKEKMLSGKENVVIKFKDLFNKPDLKPTYFCELKNDDMLKYGTEEIKIATIEDAKRVYDFIEKIEEFNAIRSTIERVEQKLKTKAGRIYYIEDENQNLLSVSQTTAENSQSAMIVGVATSKEARGKGYMTQCLSKLSYDLLSEGKKLCLFYDNPKAGEVYHKIGYKAIDNWMMITEMK